MKGISEVHIRSTDYSSVKLIREGDKLEIWISGLSRFRLPKVKSNAIIREVSRAGIRVQFTPKRKK
jgi:hypothetical protein